jgi:hypothetical protein
MNMDDIVKRAVQRVCDAVAGADVVTFERLNAILRPAEFTTQQIEQILNGLAERGIQIIED